MNNTSLLNVAYTQRKLFSPYITMSVNTIYIILCVVGVLFNFITMVVFYRETTLRRPFNIILLNLFMADMMFSLTMQPYVWIDFAKITERGRMGGFVCAVSIGIAFPMVCMTANCLSLFAITLLRYLSVVRKYNGIFATSMSLTKGFCAFTWITGVCVTIPNIISYKYNHNEAICYREWPDGINGSVYSAITTSVFLVAILLVMMVSYIMLALHIWKHDMTSSLRNSVAGRAKKNVAALLGLLILAVVFCWSPMFMVWFLGRTFDYFPNSVEGEFKRQRWLRISTVFAMTNPVLDPLIYAYSSSEYRTGLMRLYRRCKRNRLGVAPDRAN